MSKQIIRLPDYLIAEIDLRDTSEGIVTACIAGIVRTFLEQGCTAYLTLSSQTKVTEDSKIGSNLDILGKVHHIPCDKRRGRSRLIELATSLNREKFAEHMRKLKLFNVENYRFAPFLLFMGKHSKDHFPLAKMASLSGWTLDVPGFLLANAKDVAGISFRVEDIVFTVVKRELEEEIRTACKLELDFEEFEWASE